MKLFHLSWQVLILTVLALCLNGTVHAQDDGGATIIVGPQGGGGEPITGGGSLDLGFGSLSPATDGIAFLPNTNWAAISSLQVTPGSSLVLNVEFFGNGTAPLHSFSLGFNDEPYLTLASFTSTLPAGYTSSFANNTFTGQNVSGTDISAALITTTTGSDTETTDTVTNLGTLTFTVDPNAPIGTVLTLPFASTFSFLDAGGNQLDMGSLEFRAGPTVAAPELPVIAMVLLTLLALAILAWVFPRLGSARA